MTNLEKKRKEAEMHSVMAAKVNMECKIMELENEISRLTDNIKIQLDKETSLKKELGLQE
jgi:hypothetical protein